jgi:hypothetical protein
VKPESGRLVLSIVNIALALSLVVLTYRTFSPTVKHEPDPGEVPQALDPQKLAVHVSVQQNKADQFASAWKTLDKPKPVEAPTPVAAAPVQPEDINKFYQLIGVAIDPKNPDKSSALLQKRTGGDQASVTVGEEIESYKVTKIVEAPDGSVNVTVLDKTGKPTEVKITKEQLKNN